MEGTLKPEDAWVFTKAQFASPEMHIQIVGLLKYLKQHQIPDLEVHDEGGHISEFSAEEVALMIEGLIREKIGPDDIQLIKANKSQ